MWGENTVQMLMSRQRGDSPPNPFPKRQETPLCLDGFKGYALTKNMNQFAAKIGQGDIRPHILQWILANEFELVNISDKCPHSLHRVKQVLGKLLTYSILLQICELSVDLQIRQLSNGRSSIQIVDTVL